MLCSCKDDNTIDLKKVANTVTFKTCCVYLIELIYFRMCLMHIGYTGYSGTISITNSLNGFFVLFNCIESSLFSTFR